MVIAGSAEPERRSTRRDRLSRASAQQRQLNGSAAQGGTNMPDRDRMTSEPGPSRRTMLRGAAGIGAAGLAAGAIAGLAAAPAFAATDQPASGDRPAAAAAGAEHSDHAAAAEPVVVHL